MPSPSYPPGSPINTVAGKRRQSVSSQDSSPKIHGRQRSASSNTNTLINPIVEHSNGSASSSTRTPFSAAPPTAYVFGTATTQGQDSGKTRQNHRPGRSITSTVADSHQTRPPSAFPLKTHQRSRSGSSTLSTNMNPIQIGPQNGTPLKALHSPSIQHSSSQPGTHIQTEAPVAPRFQEKGEHTCCGVIEASVERAREDRYGEQAGVKPQPWIVLKLAVAFTLGIMGYAAYVYIGVLVLPMIQQRSHAEGTRREGIGLVTGFGILYIWMVWAYFKIVTTSPGYAKDHVPLTPKPPCITTVSSTVGGPSPRPSQTLSFAASPQSPSYLRRPSQDSRYTLNLGDPATTTIRNIGGPSYEELSVMLAQDPSAEALPNGNVRSGRSLDLNRQAEGGGALERSFSQPTISAPKGKNTLAVPTRPLPASRTTSTMTVKRLQMSEREDEGLRFHKGDMRNGNTQLEAELSGSESEPEDEGRPRESRASLSLKEVLGASGPQPRDADVEAQAGVVDSAVAGMTKAGRLRRKKGSASSDNIPLFCCWWLGSSADAKPPNSKRKSIHRSRSRSIGSLSTGGGAKPRTYIARRPPMTPYLDPFIRYCDKDGFVKPYRAHHCRNCGTCVLKYDHHCPWIGQCVGARNHKFFLNFCLAACVCCSYIIGSTIPFMIKGFTDIGRDVQIHEIVIVALAALFTLFTFSLAVSHTWMIMTGQTTVEHMQILTMRERESDQLSKAYSCWHFGGKRRTLQEWDREWGKLNTEGHLWWIGGKRREWEAVMGTSVLGWFLPIGKSPSDGLEYPMNPRFEPGSGRWRRRDEWPPELR